MGVSVMVKAIYNEKELTKRISFHKNKLLIELSNPKPNPEFLKIHNEQLEFLEGLRLNLLLAPNQEINISDFR